MANAFKSSSKTNIGTTITNLYTCGISGSETKKTTVLLGITLSNTTSSTIKASIVLDRPTGTATTNEPKDDVFVVKDALIPSGSSLEVMSGNRIVLQYFTSVSTGDILKAYSDTATSLDVVVSYLEIT